MKDFIIKNRIKIIVGIILLSIFYFYLIKPTISGYGVYQQIEKRNTSIEVFTQDMEDLNSKLDEAETKSETYKELIDIQAQTSNNLSKELVECETKTNECSIEQNNTKNNFEQEKLFMEKVHQLEKTKLLIEINTTKAELKNKKIEYDKLSAFSAREICCRKKFNTPSINSYSVGGGFILCSDSGDNELNC